MASLWNPLQNSTLCHVIWVNSRLIRLKSIKHIRKFVFNPLPAKFRWCISGPSWSRMCTSNAHSNVPWERRKPCPCTVWTDEVASPTRYKSPFFNQGPQVVTVKTIIWYSQRLPITLISYCHSNLWTLADSIYTSKLHKAMQREIRVRASKAHKKYTIYT